MIKENAGWLLPILAAALIAPFTPALDLAVSHFFYQPETGFTSNAFYTFLFNYGPLPAQILAGLAVLVWLLSFLLLKYKVWRRPAVCLILTMAIGAGLIVHVILKDHWGRPRPKQTIEFGGSQPFRPFYKPNIFQQPEPSKSFSCGHCSMGFYFFSLALIGRRLKIQTLFWLGLACALLLGILLSFTRIAQGGHYLSDTLMTALIMWLTAYGCDRLLFSKALEGNYERTY